MDDTGAYVDAYIASTHKCLGCEEIAHKQAEIPEGKAGAGMKVLLLPPQVMAAREIAEQLIQQQQSATTK